ncbi:MAG: 50S ribosomal protein L4 [Kiritimatiellia bacterium]
MSKLPVFDLKGSSAGEYEVADELLELKRGKQAVQDVVVAYRAGLRAGTASTLSKGMVSGSNRKPWQQKGLGRARAGYRQSPVWRGGAVVFGPHPRSYAKKVIKGVASLAYARVISEKFAGGAVRVLNELSLSDGKTRELALVLKNLKVKGAMLLVVEKQDEKLKRAARNMQSLEVCLARDVNVYQLMRYPELIATREAMAVLVDRLRKAVGAEK